MGRVLLFNLNLLPFDRRSNEVILEQHLHLWRLLALLVLVVIHDRVFTIGANRIL